MTERSKERKCAIVFFKLIVEWDRKRDYTHILFYKQKKENKKISCVVLYFQKKIVYRLYEIFDY